MKRWLIRSVQVAALAMGGLALTGTAAHADWDSGPNVGFFNGNQSSTTVQMPVNICGNSLAIVGFANANCNGGAYAYSGNGGNYSGAGYHNSRRGDGDGNANANGNRRHRHHNNGNGNANANSNSNDGYNHHNGGGAYASSNNGDWTTGYNAGFFNGNQSSTTVQVPINVSCNSVAVIGFASSC